MKAKIVDQQSLDDVLTLLKESNLPHQDIKLINNLFVSYHDDSDALIGSGGLEFYSQYALIRSVAVTKSQRGRDFGKEIVKDLLDRAMNNSVKEIYLLTETAHGFFLNRGFQDITRENVPDQIKASSEFSSVCPVSAACMVYRFN